jgi:hypothetical protein
VLLWASKREDRRLAAGQTYEPPTIVERRNWMGAHQERPKDAPSWMRVPETAVCVPDESACATTR